jgi:hypothetical protein
MRVFKPIRENQSFKFIEKRKTRKALQDATIKAGIGHIFCLTICLTVNYLGGTCYMGLYPHAGRPALRAWSSRRVRDEAN